jgi:hypothetical protein
MQIRSRLIISILPVLAIMLPAAGFSQATSGTLIGTVQDPSGAVVPNASVTITDTLEGPLTKRLPMNPEITRRPG